MKPLLILDRDGVLNELIYDQPTGRAPRSTSEVRFVPSIEEIRMLHNRYSIVCITNQPDIANKIISQENALSVHSKIMEYFDIKTSLMCTHNNNQFCACRKPGTLMLELAESGARNSDNVTIVGDRWTDILAGNRLGWRTVLMQHDDFSMERTSQGSPPEDLKINIKVDSWKDLIKELNEGFIA
jgi:D-glycero-D-manno-heptose 1,7-bisphosphate phosphatase